MTDDRDIDVDLNGENLFWCVNFQRHSADEKKSHQIRLKLGNLSNRAENLHKLVLVRWTFFLSVTLKIFFSLCSSQYLELDHWVCGKIQFRKKYSSLNLRILCWTYLDIFFIVTFLSWQTWRVYLYFVSSVTLLSVDHWNELKSVANFTKT